MGLINVHSFVAGNWLPADDGARPIASAVTGEPLAIAGQASLDTASMIDYARQKGGPALRAMTFHDRARMLKALALELGKFKDELYALSYTTGATKPDSMIDIDGGIGTVLRLCLEGQAGDAGFPNLCGRRGLEHAFTQRQRFSDSTSRRSLQGVGGAYQRL
jgi:oxepin-CoA hydrolase/3-oxo-5,6-dehydrosuberyl-CoA semialdehyde dehydrogenase